jgi:hypothetical protein
MSAEPGASGEKKKQRTVSSIFIEIFFALLEFFCSILNFMCKFFFNKKV